MTAAPIPGDARAALVRLVRDEGRRVLATLVRHTGDLQLAEDAVQDAVLRALDTWPRTGVPPQPRAWLTLTARNRAVDLVRRESARTGKEAEAVRLLEPPADEPPEMLRDDQLRLVFTCCHPALALETQVALALHTLCGLSTAEVGRALLVPEATMSKRLTRAKQKIARAHIPYRVPDAAELPDRLHGVAATVVPAVHRGLRTADGATGRRRGAAPGPAAARADARRAGRARPAGAAAPAGLAALQPASPQPATPCRWPSRTARGGTGRRSPRAWCSSAKGCAAPPTAPTPTSSRPPSPPATRWPRPSRDTDWAAVLSWYDVLLTVHDTPVVRLNRAVAVGECRGPEAALAELDALAGLGGYPLWHATRAELLARLSAWRGAAAFDAALALPPQRRPAPARGAGRAGRAGRTTAAGESPVT